MHKLFTLTSLFIALALPLAGCGDGNDDETGQTTGESQVTPTPEPTIPPEFEKLEFKVATISVEICIDGKDVLTVADNQMQLENKTYYPAGTHWDCGWFDDARIRIDDLYNPYTVWVLAPWVNKKSSVFNLNLPVNLDEPDRVANLTVHQVHGDGRVYLDWKTNQIVFDDNGPSGPGRYHISFEYWYFQ